MTEDAAAGAWVVEVAIDAAGPLPAEWTEWLWALFGDRGLVGIAEGEVSVNEAAEAGLVGSPLVIDAAAAPRARDWVAMLGGGPLRCWFDSERAAREAADALRAKAGCEVRSLRWHEPEPDDAWRAGFTAIDVPGFGRVLPAWEEGRADASAVDATIFIEPGIGFGTAFHPTTQLCLAAVRAWAAAEGRGGRVLDFGSGSGVLGIAAAVLGADRVDAVEIDDAVHAAIRQNAARNEVAERIAVCRQPPAAGAGYDLVVANIVAEVLLDHATALCAALRRDAAGRPIGWLVLSGLRAEDLPAVSAGFEALLATQPRQTERDGWHCFCWPGGDGEVDRSSLPGLHSAPTRESPTS